MSDITTVEIKSLGKTRISMHHTDLVFDGDDNQVVGVEISNETILFAADQIKNAVGQLDFDAWLKSVCFQKPTPEAYGLAKAAWKASRCPEPIPATPVESDHREAYCDGCDYLAKFHGETHNCNFYKTEVKDYVHHPTIERLKKCIRQGTKTVTP